MNEVMHIFHISMVIYVSFSEKKIFKYVEHLVFLLNVQPTHPIIYQVLS